VVPLSVIYNWKHDIQKFGQCDCRIRTAAMQCSECKCGVRLSVDVLVHHGVSSEERGANFLSWMNKVQKSLQRLRNQGGDGVSASETVYVVLTTYEVALKDERLLSSLGRCRAKSKRKSSCIWKAPSPRAEVSKAKGSNRRDSSNLCNDTVKASWRWWERAPTSLLWPSQLNQNNSAAHNKHSAYYPWQYLVVCKRIVFCIVERINLAYGMISG
jgi:hypothetical protein